jgi:tetratricopeptide (TPR) repeat protein
MHDGSARREFRCAIYTRKSSEEGLEQGFNSLHAQREACEAYIKSQKHEGWKGLSTHYDDGGYSGGSMERPALRRLLADIAAKRIGGLPLAHEQAAAYCERLAIGIAEYSRRFAATPSRMLDDIHAAPAEYHDGRTVAKTFALAIEEAAKRHPAAEPLLVHAALLAREPIPLFLFSEAREKFGEPLATALAGDGLDEAVATLRAFALVDREVIADERDPAITTDCIRLHPLVRQVAAARLEGEARDAAKRALVDGVAAVYPTTVQNDPQTWPRARRLEPLALNLADSDAVTTGSEASAARLLDGVGSYWEAALAAYKQAQRLFERALAIRERVFGSDHSETARSLSNLASLLYAQGDFAVAQPLFERALAIEEKVLGPEHPDTATTLEHIGLLLQARGDLAAARPLFERALAIREKFLGPSHPATATGIFNLARLLQGQEELAAARPLFERALAIYQKVLGPEHPNTNRTRQNLAGLLLALGDAAQALALAETALAALDKALGREHRWTKDAARITGDVFEAFGRADEARTLRARYGVREAP